MQPTISASGPHDLPTPGRLLRRSTTAHAGDLSGVFGFGGVHGGLLLAMLTKECATTVGPRGLRHVTAQFHRPADGDFRLVASTAEVGRTLTRSRGCASRSGRDLMTAVAVFSDVDEAGSSLRPITPRMPRVEPPGKCDVFSIPIELVPFAQHTEIRPTDASRPFTGGQDPTLTAWIRFVEDDEAPDAYRLITLLDALAPSYAAVLDQPAAIPTVELAVRTSAGLERAESPWVLVRATTVSTHGNWIDERIDAWSPDGEHLGSANQMRLLVQ